MWSLFKLAAVVWLLLCIYVAVTKDPKPARSRPRFYAVQA